jgi:hypothetical protein
MNAYSKGSGSKALSERLVSARNDFTVDLVVGDDCGPMAGPAARPARQDAAKTAIMRLSGSNSHMVF